MVQVESSGSRWSPGGVHSPISKTCTLTILHVESTWSPVESMWSYGVHVDSMGEGKVHPIRKRAINLIQMHLLASTPSRSLMMEERAG